MIGGVESVEIVDSTTRIDLLPESRGGAELIVCIGFGPAEIELLIGRCELSNTGVVVLGESASAIDLRDVANPVGLIEHLDDRRLIGALIRAVADGLSARTPDMHSSGPIARGDSEDLTAREREVLRYVAGGFSNGEIAKYLSISLNTVKYHLAQIMKKLGAANRTEAVLRAIQSGELEA